MPISAYFLGTPYPDAHRTLGDALDPTQAIPHNRLMSTHDHALEEGSALTPRFDSNGLITAVVVDADDGQILMLAHMTQEALDLTIKTGIGTFFSRSRGKLWVKGESSGNRLRVSDLRIDCDQDAVLVIARLEGDGVACHTGRRSCFYRRIENDGTLSFVE